MRLNFAFLSLLLLFLAALFACKERQTGTFEVPDAAEQWAYFPLSIGRYTIWQVDSVVYGGVDVARDSSRTFVKEVVTDTLRDNAGLLVYKIERYERKSDTAAWQIRHIRNAARTENEAIWSENNVRYRSLIFPMTEKTNWNGLAYIDSEREIQIAGNLIRPWVYWDFQVDSLDVPGQIGAFSFDSLLVVTEADETYIAERRFSKAVYAKNVGLVRKEQWILDSQYCNQVPPPADCETRPWEQKGENGYLLRLLLLEHN